MSLFSSLPSGPFDVIYADPPWDYDCKNVQGAANKHYQTVTIKDLQTLPVSEIAATDSCLFMWATYPLLPEALELGEAWGFEYKTLAFQWIKVHTNGRPILGLGHWTRGNTEPVLLFVRGKYKRQGPKDISQLVITARGEHSAKPPEVRSRIESLCGGGGRAC